MVDDEDTTTSDLLPKDATLPQSSRKKPMSYSQPLDGDATYHGPRRKAGMPRNHSLDEEDFAATDDGHHHIFYQHSTSLPEEALRRHRHLPPQHHQLSFGCPTAYLSLERIMSASVPGAGGSGNVAEDGKITGPTLTNPNALPEFMGSGGAQGIFKVPVRGALQTGCPPSLELRPHPLRETQVGTFLRTIACGCEQVWAGVECGVRVWYLEEVFKGVDEVNGAAVGRGGDEEAAPFHESYRTPAALCLVVDVGSRLVWSGHKDGKIRSWKMDGARKRGSLDRDNGQYASAPSNNNTGGGNSGGGAGGFKEGLSWQAHRGPILCMTFTSDGDLWAGSEGGAIKSWPWESIQKSLSLKTEERHMAALLVERSYVDLRSLVTVGGVCSLPSADVRFLLSDNSSSKVWSGGSSSFALWNSHTKELLKVFNIDGHVENRVDVELNLEEETLKAKHGSTSKKDKSQGSVGFFQRSRNALMGAADAVRRVATKGAFGEDNRRTEAMTVSTDGMVWTGCANGALVQWDDNGNRIHELQHHSSSVVSLCTYGTRLWVGYASGDVQMLDLEGNLLGGWAAHSSPVMKMAVGGGFVFTLAKHGGIRGWHLTSPGPLDGVLRSEVTGKDQMYTRFESFKILVGTWNVGQERAAHDSLASWLGGAASEADIVVVGLQEIEMGAGFLAMAAAKETVGLEGSANGHMWLDDIGKTLDEGAAFERVGSRQLAGLLISAWARKSLRKHIGDVDAAAVACGFGRAIGNKGGVGLRMRIYGRIVCFANCHFAAHLEAVNKRNADFDHIFRTMSFSRPSNGHHACGAGSSSSAVQVNRGPNAGGIQSDDGTPELAEADMIIFLGDFNYRLHGISYDEARDFVSQRCFDWLREKDQLREEMKAGKVFQGMREGLIRFPPTYKFERHRVGLSGYDSGEKKRIPAWCDRILYRDNRSISLQECSLECPMVSSILQYDACMDVTDSDHKPVRCLLAVDVARIDKTVRRQEFGRILLSNEKIRSLLEENCTIPETTVSTNSITLQHQETSIFTITNKCDKDKAIVEISCDGVSMIKEDGIVTEPHPRGGSGFPRWLSVTPKLGVIKAGEAMEVMLCLDELPTADEPVDGILQSSRYEDIKDKEVILAVNVTGNFSMEKRSHQIRMRHRLPSRSTK